MTSAKQAFLGNPKTAGYRPAVFGGYMFQSLFTGQWPMFLLGEVEAMRYDPKVQLATAILRAPLHQLKVKVSARQSAVGHYVGAQFRRIWQSSLRKLANYLDYGHIGGEVCYKQEQGHVVFDQLRDVYPRDAVPLIDYRKGGVVGVQVKSYLGGGNSGGENTSTSSLVNLFAPRAFWAAHRARYAGYFGYSRFNGAWWPWLEKRGRHGATDVRRTWFIKNAYRGMRIRHPPGYIERPDGSLQANQDYAREIAEKAEAGGVMALPNAKNPNESDYQWTIEDPAVNGDIAGVREYSRDLDREILEGFEIPPEVAEAAEVGAGWSGRSVPFMVFLAGEDEIVAELVDAIDRWILRPLVEVNFGSGQVYEIEPVSLIELLGQAREGGAQAGQPHPAPPTSGGERPATAERIRLSVEDDEGHLHGNDGKFTGKGGGTKDRNRRAKLRRKLNKKIGRLGHTLGELAIRELPRYAVSDQQTLAALTHWATRADQGPEQANLVARISAQAAGDLATAPPREDADEEYDRLKAIQVLRRMQYLARRLVEAHGRRQQPVQMSLDGDTDRANKESVNALLDSIIDQGSVAGVIAGDEIRRKIRALVKKKSRKPS